MSDQTKPTCPFCRAELRHTSPQANWFDCGSKVNKSLPDQYSQSFLCAQAERDRMAKELEEAKERIRRLEEEAEANAWTVSPAMAQAKIDELNERIRRLEEAGDAMVEGLGASTFDSDRIKLIKSELICDWAKAKEAQA
jgi:flagellar motility protein MotE (MotC chaperone)